jgi:hypothetical protein
MIAALFVQEGGAYYGLPNVDPWPESRDARLYAGPWPVVAHPPCERWTNFARLNFKRYGGEHNRPGNDGGCFASALENLRLYGGVLEHPAGSLAFDVFCLPRPTRYGWQMGTDGFWTTEVDQAAYGHRARKSTWLVFSSGFHEKSAPPLINWARVRGTHQIGGFDVTLPQLPKKERAATPPAFRDLLISIAESACRPETGVRDGVV